MCFCRNATTKLRGPKVQMCEYSQAWQYLWMMMHATSIVPLIVLVCEWHAVDGLAQKMPREKVP